jgi:hypothetical protein
MYEILTAQDFGGERLALIYGGCMDLKESAVANQEMTWDSCESAVFMQ